MLDFEANNLLLLEENRELRQLLFYLVKFHLKGSVIVDYKRLMQPFYGVMDRVDTVDGYRLNIIEDPLDINNPKKDVQ